MIDTPQSLQLRHHSLIVNEFYLPPTQIATLKSHFLRYWTGHYFRSNLSPSHTIQFGTLEYICVLPMCTHSKLFDSPQVKLSFRESKPEFNIPAYVLVRFA